MHTKEGKEMDIRETQVVEYTLLNVLSDEWVIAGLENCPAFGGIARFSFSEAIKFVKRGMKVRRATDISFPDWEMLETVFSVPNKGDTNECQAQ